MSKVDYIRTNMDVTDKELADELSESEYYIWVVKEAYRNNYFRQQAKASTKLDEMLKYMKDYLISVEYNTLKELESKFNRTFGQSYLTPMNYQTLRKYRKRILAQREA